MTVKEIRESVVAPVIDAVQRNPVTALAVNLKDGLRAISDSPGAAPVHAFVRQGGDEFAQVLVAFPAQGIQPVSEMGQIFEPTPQLVTGEMTGKDVSPVDYLGRQSFEGALDMAEVQGVAKAERQLTGKQSVAEIMAAGKEVEQAREQKRELER